jgi:hypothetical protein
MQFRLDVKYPGPGLIEVRFRSVPIQGRSFFCPRGSAGHWSPSPCGRLSRPRTNTGPPSRRSGIGRRRSCPSCSHRGWALRDASHVHRVPLMGVVPSFAPAAWLPGQRSLPRSLAGQIGFLPDELVRHRTRRPTHCFGPYRPGSGPLTNRRVSAAGSLALHRPILLARPRRLVMPPARYVVRAAPARRSNSCGELPSASLGRCGGRGRTSRSARIHGASWRTPELVDDEQIRAEQPSEDPADAVVGEAR